MDTRIQPDWAGTAHAQVPPYLNQVPGDTKQSRKWTSNMKNSPVATHQEEFLKALRQVLLYCIRVNSRYGYIITDAEAFFFCRKKFHEPVDPLCFNQSRRQHAQSFQPIHG